MYNLFYCPYNRQYYDQYLTPVFLPINQYVNPHYYEPRQFAMLITPDELTKLQGKRIRTTVPNLGSIMATVGPYDPNTNRVQLQNIVSVQDGVNHGTLGYLPSDLGGYQIIDAPSGTGGSDAGTAGEPPSEVFTEEQLSTLVPLTKTLGSFDYPSPTWTDPTRMRRYRVYLEVTVPQVIAQSVQSSLDKCMEVAKAKALTIIAPFLTPVTVGGLAGAIPGAIGAGFQAFSLCVASNPMIYPYLNRIKLDIKTSDKVV